VTPTCATRPLAAGARPRFATRHPASSPGRRRATVPIRFATLEPPWPIERPLTIFGRRLLNVWVKFWEAEVASAVRSTSADTLSDQPLSEWPAARDADRTLAQRTAAVGLTDRGSLSELALTADRPAAACR
jgi:hypothetical protein